jgi:putative hydrolase of the HAD superfamily
LEGAESTSLTIGFVTVRGVIFDWGGVITSPIIDTVQAWLSAEGIDRDSYTSAMRPWVRRSYGAEQQETPIQALERGEVADAEFELALASLLVTDDGAAVLADGLLKRMFAASVVQPEMLDLIRELRASGLKIGLLSNSWGGTKDDYPAEILAELFDATVISGQVGMRKPEERIFRLAAEQLGLEPAECVFVDDVEGNITAARALGFGVVHHREPVATKAELLDLLAH